MTLPPLLEQHMNQLRREGYDIEVTVEGSGEQARIYLVFKEYPIPASIWGRTTGDLLIVAQGVYPNAKLDMFWVYPKLLLPDGRLPEGGNSDESYLGRVWQRFSWHPSAWNPARDNLITYLELVNHRLHQRR